MQTRYSDDKAVRPSLRPSVTRVDYDKTEERSVQIFIPYERSFSRVFLISRMVDGGNPIYLKF